MKIHQVSSGQVLEFIRSRPGVTYQRINIHFGRTNMSKTLSRLKGKGLIKDKIEPEGVNRNWMVKCYYPIK